MFLGFITRRKDPSKYGFHFNRRRPVGGIFNVVVILLWFGFKILRHSLKWPINNISKFKCRRIEMV